MADQILQFTANTTPDQPGSAVTSPTNTGHGVTGVGAGSNPVSCRWSSLQSPGGQTSRLVLTFSYSWQFLTGGVNSVFYVQYSTDGGSNWTDAVRLDNANDTTGNVSVDLPVVGASLIQVRDYAEQLVAGTHSIQITSLQIEAYFQTGGMMVMM